MNRISNKFCRFLSFILALVAVFSVTAPALYADESGEDTSLSDTAEQLDKLISDGEQIPVMNITTDNGKLNKTKRFKGASMSLTLTDRFSEYENEYTTETGGRIEMKARGNSSYTSGDVTGTGKYSYKIKLENKANLLGMGESKHWVLISNVFDVTNMRNKLVYDLSGMMGMPYTQSRWVVLYVNGTYYGLYSLCEALRLDEQVVNITDWEKRAKNVAEAIGRAESMSEAETAKLVTKMKKDLSWITSGTFENYKISDYYDTSDFNINSGYLIEYDERMDGTSTKFRTSHGKPIELCSPSTLDTNTEMYNYVVDLLNDFEEAIYSENFCTSDGRHYSEFVDVDSMVDYFIIFNLFKNIEFGWLSIYLYIENGKIYFGPCWDFDNASANQVTLTDDWYRYDNWFNIGGRADWWKELCADPLYVTKVENRWFEIRDLVDEMLTSMDYYHDYIEDEALKNYDWAGAPHNWYMQGSQTEGFEIEFQTMKDWMYNRVEWLDEQWSLRDPNMEDRGLEKSDRLVLSLRSSGADLVKEKSTVASAPADYQYDINDGGNITLRIVTNHTTHRYAEVYVNGVFVKKVECSQSKSAKVTLDKSLFDLTEGSVNVIYVAMINNSDEYYRAGYLTVRATVSPKEDYSQVSLKLGYNGVKLVEKGSVVTLPEITVKYAGYEALGWTDGEYIYPEGYEFTVEESTYLYYCWKRTILFPDMAEPEEEPVVYPDDPVEPDDNTESGLPAGAIVAISAGSAALVCAVAVFVVIRLKKSKKAKKDGSGS